MSQVKAEKSRLRLLRERYGLAQEQLARLSNITLNTYRSAEYGNNVNYTTAMAILDALNTVRTERGIDFEFLELDDLGLSIV